MTKSTRSQSGISRWAVLLAIAVVDVGIVAAIVAMRSRAPDDPFHVPPWVPPTPLRAGEDRRFDVALDALRGSAEFTFLEGVPRWNPARESGSEARPTQVSHGQSFYEQPLRITAEDERELREVLPEPALYRQRDQDVYKLCGGFHADFAFAWISHDGPCEMHFCLGCNEVNLYTPDGQVSLDILESERLRALLMRHETLRQTDAITR